MVKGISVSIGGQDYIVPAMNLKGVRSIEKKLKDLSIAQIDSTSLTEEQIDIITDIVLVGLQRNYPDMTKEKLEDILDMNNVQTVIEAITGQAGLKKKLTEKQAESLSTGGENIKTEREI